MTPDGFDDVRVLLRELDPGPLPDLDVDAIVRGGELERRRRARSRWYAVAAVLVVVAAVGAGLLTLARPEAVGPAAPGGSSSPTPGTSSFRPTPYTPQQWLLYAQPDIDNASSVRVRQLLAPGQSTATVDAVLGPRTADGTVSVDGVTSRYIAVDGVTYVEPAVLVQLGLMSVPPEGTARWVKLSGQRFRLPSGVRSAGGVNLADGSGMALGYGAARDVDGTPTTVIETQIDAGNGVPARQSYFLRTEAPHLPLLLERDGREIARFSDWNAPIATPVAPPASEVTTVPGL
jgi:hypothetical protein